MTLLAGYLAIWLKKCVVPYQSGDILPLEVLYPAIQLAYKKELSLLPVMVANIHRGLRQISSAFTQKEDVPSARIPLTKVELPYTYLMAWFVLHRSDMMSVPNATDHSVPLLQLLENNKWEGRGFPDIRKQLQVHKCWAFSTCFPQFSSRYGEGLIDEEKPREYRTHLDIGCFNWLVNIRPGYLTFRVRNQCFIEPYLPCRFARQFGYDQLYVGNPRQQLRTHGGLVDGLRAWLWTVTGCTGAKFSLPSAERQLNLTFLSCRWLLAANKTVPVKSIAELVAEEASQADSRVIWEGARSQRTRSKTCRIDKEGKKIFNSADEASSGDFEDYEDCSERGTAADKDEEFRPSSQARHSIVVPAARRKRLAHKPHADSRASEMDLAGDDPASDGGEHEDSEMSPDPAPHDCVFSGEPDSPYQVEKHAEAADVRETINVGPDSANPDKLQEANVDLGNKEASTPIRDFSTDDFDEEGLLVDTPMLHFMYGSPQIDDQMPEDMFPECTLPKNPEDGPSEAFVETDPVEPAVRPTTLADTSTAVTPPLPPVTQGEGGIN
ncbi:uncharacterized protein A4U43_C09F11780 [Asparagus officinalis]|uniref:Aminotransferase-like plant mobile domain-containing protein n=1 Tax=Asparagus officinalis TaxID=4686 RepID=A0A5P1E748_ASPOF|nr:uncharacterized protein A4U43_C09F11780 [Asparagus officinalis]